MELSELKYLFKKYLKREPNEIDIESHLKKSPKTLEDEIKICTEYIEIIKTKKIAILISGHIRYNNILEGILKYCNNNKFDIFIHTWDTLGHRGTETDLAQKTNIDKIKEEIEKFPNVKLYLIENNTEFIHKIKDNKIKYFNFSSPEPFIISQLYSVNQSYKLFDKYRKETHQQYDLVIKFRFDMQITKFELRGIIEDCNNHKIIFIPNKDNNHTHYNHGICWACEDMFYNFGLKEGHIFPHTNIICDTFAYGNVEAMKKYCSLYNEYDKINEKNEKLNLASYKIRKNQNIHENLNGYKLTSHIESLYYYYCSYPEHLLPLLLKDYMLVESKEIKIRLVI